MDKMMIRREAVYLSFLCLALCAAGAGGQTPRKPTLPPSQRPLPVLSPQQIFKRVSPSVMVVESLDAKGSVTVSGSGVVIAPGHIVTNRHVIEDGVSYRVEHGGNKWPATLVRVDPDHDLAELSIAGFDAPAVRVRDSSTLAVGEMVYAIGAPEGLELTISEGLISGLRDFDKDRVIQTSAAISPGSSGGGLFDAEGRLVGITTFYLKEGQSLNFALPAEWTLALNRQPANGAPAATENSPAFQALVWFEAGDKAFDEGKYDAAARALKEGLRLKPNEGIRWAGLALAYEELGQRDKEIEAYEQGVRMVPSDGLLWWWLGDAYLGRGDYKKAAFAYQETVRLSPDNEMAWESLEVADLQLGQYNEALSAGQEAVKLKPDDEGAWDNMGTAYNFLAKYDKAAESEQEAIRLKPDDARPWLELGLAFKGEGRQSDVVRVYEKLKVLDPKLADKFFRAEVLP